MKPIPCLDLQVQHANLKKEIFASFEKVYDEGGFSSGSSIKEFESAWAKIAGVDHAIAVGNGTQSLHLAMLALGVGPGDEVIVPANTFIATAWGVTHAGGTPVFVDCDPDTWQIDPVKVRDAVTSKTKGVIGVHLYGQPFDVDAVKAVCEEHRLFLVEDCAQAQGAYYKGRRVGTMGEIACFSFYPSKNLGACGEGGGILTNSRQYADHMRALRNHGGMVRLHHDEIGFNYRMGGLEAASLLVKLKYLDGWNEKRREIANRYLTEIKNPKIKMQKTPEWAQSATHIFGVTTANRDEFAGYLEQNGIIPAYHYPIPCHLQKAYAFLGYKKGDMPNTEYRSFHGVSLPLYPELTREQVDKVIAVVNQY